MKRFIALVVANTLFHIGDKACTVMEMVDNERWASAWYSVYCRCMLWSLEVDLWGDAGVWNEDPVVDDL